MDTNIVVSIICTVFNKEKWIEQTIFSLLNQRTTFDTEIIIVDDASTDGSKQIIKSFVDAHPDKIVAIYNPKNFGIAKTWVMACQKARGKYIARCDGDDFWLDPLKLQKQYELLEASTDSKWANSDFDIYDENGEFISASGFETGTIPLADSYEKMLATRGFTMASTWLVEKNLMLEVNEELDLNTSDDTFNLQLDLFQKTKLSYLPESTVAYRINHGSDSRPSDFNQLRKRFNNLLNVQLRYLDKYPNVDFKKMTKILLHRNNEYELIISESPVRLSQIGNQHIKIYHKSATKDFNENDFDKIILNEKDCISFSLPEDSDSVRIDLSNISSYFKKVLLINSADGMPVPSIWTNGYQIDNQYLFTEDDPQIIYSIEKFNEKKFTLVYEMFNVDNLSSNDYLGKEYIRKYDSINKKLVEANSQKNSLLQELENLRQEYNAVIGSRRWIIPTKIINFFRRNK